MGETEVCQSRPQLSQTGRPRDARTVQVEASQGVAGGAHGQESSIVEGWYAGEGQELEVHQAREACQWLGEKQIAIFTAEDLQLAICK